MEILSAIALIILLLLLTFIPKNKEFELAKQKYYYFLNNLPEQFKGLGLERPVVLSGYSFRGGTVLGWNSLKGSEIAVCIDGKSNEILHILLHEFCHQTVPEYSHSKRFWDNLDAVKDHAERLGIYERILESRKICGSHVTDVKK